MNYQWLIHGGDRNKWVWHYWRIYFEGNCVLPNDLGTIFLTEKTPIPPAWAPIKPCTPGINTFTTQLIKYLKSPLANKKYILYSMDDFFLVGQPQFDRINKLVAVMQQTGIKLIKLFDNPHTRDARFANAVDKNNLHLYEYWRPYIISCQPSIWEKEFLFSFLHEGQTGYELEIEGSIKCKQNAFVYTDPMSIFPYKEGIRQGKIRKGSEHLFEKANLPQRIV